MSLQRSWRDHPVLKALASYGLWLMILVTCPILFIGAFAIWLVTVPFDPRLRALHLYTCAWAALYTYVFPYWRVHVRGREHIRPGVTYVLASNHQSLLDILVLFRLYKHFKWVSKAVMFRWPFVGWNMSLNRYIAIRRGDRTDARRMLQACGTALDGGSSIMIFPEGTRSRDGRLGEFRHGAFTLALRHRVAIVPIVVEGTLDALPKHGLTLRNAANIVVVVMEPIDVANFSEAEALRDHVRAVMAAALQRLRRERGGATEARRAAAG
jgi:1-acyl-sn-glycerol-3-phosphate acyltransferase